MKKSLTERGIKMRCAFLLIGAFVSIYCDEPVLLPDNEGAPRNILTVIGDSSWLPGKTEATIGINLENVDAVVAGMQFDVYSNPDVVRIDSSTGVGRCEKFYCYSTDFRVILVHLDVIPIPAGDSTIARLFLRVSDDAEEIPSLEFQGVIFSDKEGNELPAQSLDGDLVNGSSYTNNETDKEGESK